MKHLIFIIILYFIFPATYGQSRVWTIKNIQKAKKIYNEIEDENLISYKSLDKYRTMTLEYVLQEQKNFYHTDTLSMLECFDTVFGGYNCLFLNSNKKCSDVEIQYGTNMITNDTIRCNEDWRCYEDMMNAFSNKVFKLYLLGNKNPHTHIYTVFSKFYWKENKPHVRICIMRGTFSCITGLRNRQK
jgi:hypothetical protein